MTSITSSSSEPSESEGAGDLRPSQGPLFVFPQEWERYSWTKDVSIDSLRASSGLAKRIASGQSRDLRQLSADDASILLSALASGLSVLLVKHMPRRWLSSAVAKGSKVPMLLYEPREPSIACQDCVDHGYLCAAREPSATKCYACELARSDCNLNVEASEDSSGGAILLAPLASDEGKKAVTAPLFDAAQSLCNRINKSFRVIFSTAGRRKYPLGQGGYLVAFEPSLAVFEEFLRLKKESWARFGWCDGKVIYYGDPSLVHESTIGKMIEMITSQMHGILSSMPEGPQELEDQVAEQMAHERQLLASGLIEPGHLQTRGQILYNSLFAQALSTKTEGLDPTLVSVSKQSKSRSPLKRKAVKKPVYAKKFIKEADFLFVNYHAANRENEREDDNDDKKERTEEGMHDDNDLFFEEIEIAIAGEVAFNNETLKALKDESVLWPQIAHVSICLKVDPRGSSGKEKKVKKSPEAQRGTKRCHRGSGIDDEDTNDLDLTVKVLDPLIVLFVTRASATAAEKAEFPDGLVRHQYAIGAGSGIQLRPAEMAGLRETCGTSKRLLAKLQAVDPTGQANAPANSPYLEPFPKFKMLNLQEGEQVKMPMGDALRGALNTHARAKGVDKGRPLSSALKSFVKSFALQVSPSTVRQHVIWACIRTLKAQEEQESSATTPSPRPAKKVKRLPPKDVYDWQTDSE